MLTCIMGNELTVQHSSPQTAKETDCVCTVDENQPIDLEDTDTEANVACFWCDIYIDICNISIYILPFT